MKNKNTVIICFSFLFLMLILCVGVFMKSSIKNEEGKKQKRIGVLYMTMNNPYFEVVNKEIEAVAAENGDKIITRDSSLNTEMQIRQMESMIEDGVDIILVNAVDWKGILPGLEMAKKAGIPVLALDTEVYDEELVESSITSDNYMAGVLDAQDMMKRKESGKVLLLVQSNNKSAQDRIKGFTDTLKEASWPYELVDTLECYGQLEISQPLVEEVLDKRQDIDVVMALNDPSALGAMAALDAAGMLSDVLVYGVDGAPEAKTMIANGKMAGTAAQSPTQTGKIAIEYAYRILEGEKDLEPMTVPVTLITRENIDEFSLSNWE